MTKPPITEETGILLVSRIRALEERLDHLSKRLGSVGAPQPRPLQKPAARPAPSAERLRELADRRLALLEQLELERMS